MGEILVPAANQGRWPHLFITTAVMRHLADHLLLTRRKRSSDALLGDTGRVMPFQSSYPLRLVLTDNATPDVCSGTACS